MKPALLHTLYTSLVLYLLSLLFFNLSVFNYISDALKDFSYSDMVQSKSIFNYDNVVEDVIIVNIERRDREELAMLIDHIAQQAPSVIGIDIIFKDVKNSKDSILSEVIRNHENLLVGGFIQPNIHNHKNFSCNNKGYLNLEYGNDNVIRQFLTHHEQQPSFAYEIAKKYNGAETQFMNPQPIKYYGNHEQFIHMGFDDVMMQTEIPLFKDKIILLGYLGTPIGNPNDIEDKKFTPINEQFSGKSLPDMFGVTIHANIIHSLIHKDFIKLVPEYWQYVISCILTIVTSWIFIKVAQKAFALRGLIRRIFQLIYTFFIIWVSIQLFKNEIKLPIGLIISCPMLAIELIPYFKSLHNLIEKKWGIQNIYKH